jgi:hypothetical protein
MRKAIGAILAVLLCSSSAYAAVAFDTADSVTGSGVTSLSRSCIVTGSNTLMIISGVALNADASTSATYNGVGLTLKASVSMGAGVKFLDMWFLVAPTTGTNTAVINYPTGSDRAAMSCVSFTGVHQVTPLGTAETGTDFVTGETITVPANGMAFDAAGGIDGGAACFDSTPGGSQIERIDACVGTAANYVELMHSTRATTGTFTWTAEGGEFQSQIAVPINAAAAVVSSAVTRRRFSK